MVDNSTNIKKTNSHSSPQITKHLKRPRHMVLEIQALAQNCGRVKPVNRIPALKEIKHEQTEGHQYFSGNFKLDSVTKINVT